MSKLTSVNSLGVEVQGSRCTNVSRVTNTETFATCLGIASVVFEIHAEGRLIALADDDAMALAAFSDVLNVNERLSIVGVNSGQNRAPAAYLNGRFAPSHRSFVLDSDDASADIVVQLLKESLDRSLGVIIIGAHDLTTHCH